MKFAYASDLHLEFNYWPSFKNTKSADVLLLAGDFLTAYAIDPRRNDSQARHLKKYLTKTFKPLITDNFKSVYMVMGNHEHYNSIYKKTKESLENSFRILDLPITILDNDTVDLNSELVLAGTTLWSDFENRNPVSMGACGYAMNDFRIIGSLDTEDLNYFNRYSSRVITPEFILDEHYKALSFIKDIILNKKDKKLILMAHHGVTYKSLNHEHLSNGLDGAYCSDLAHIFIDEKNIPIIVSGHTHQAENTDYMVGNTRVLTNPFGYSHELCNRLWTGFKYFEVV